MNKRNVEKKITEQFAICGGTYGADAQKEKKDGKGEICRKEDAQSCMHHSVIYFLSEIYHAKGKKKKEEEK